MGCVCCHYECSLPQPPGKCTLSNIIMKCMLLPMSDCNVQVGLAVEDVQTLRGEAQQNRIKEQVSFICMYTIDEIALTTFFL